MKSRILLLLILLSSFTLPQYRLVDQPQKLVKNEAGTFINPKWSPDGRNIALTGANYQGLWILDVVSGELTQLTEEPSAGYGYEWSLDSKSILTRVARFDEHKRYNAVKIFDVATKSFRALSDYIAFMPDLPKWSSDNTKVFFYNDGKLEVHSTGKKSLSKTSAEIKEIFLNSDKLITGNIDKQEISEINPLKDQQYLNLKISPDRSKVVFEVYGGNLFVMNTNGSNIVDLGKGYRASWSPDSKSVVYMITEDDGHAFISSDLYISSADGIQKQQLTFTSDKLEMDPDWSPDGTTIVYDENDEGAVYSITVTKN